MGCWFYVSPLPLTDITLYLTSDRFEDRITQDPALETPTTNKSIHLQSTSKMAPVSFEYHENAQKTYKPPLIANENAFLGDVFTSESNDPQAPISAGFYRLEKGKTPLVQAAAQE
jgi:hypothetical protein